MSELDLSQLVTEMRNPHTMNLDQMSPLEFVQVMNQEDAKVIAAIEEVLPQVAQAIEWVAKAFEAGGRLIYMGAGTSGRLGVLDAAECPPTFGVPPSQVIGMIAGGCRAMTDAVEGAEDSSTLGEQDLRHIKLSPRDVVVGLAASGRTPYVIYALRYAKAVGAHTIALACNRPSEIGREADLAIEPVVGPEVLTGSTRLKAGTAQKLILNMISTGSMVRTGKAYQNLMVDVQASNQKLNERARRIVMEASGCSLDEAKRALTAADGEVKTALVMVLVGASADEARERLAASGGHVRGAM